MTKIHKLQITFRLVPNPVPVRPLDPLFTFAPTLIYSKYKWAYIVNIIFSMAYLVILMHIILILY